MQHEHIVLAWSDGLRLVVQDFSSSDQLRMLIRNFQHNSYLSQFLWNTLELIVCCLLTRGINREHTICQGEIYLTSLGPKRYFTATTATRRSCGVLSKHQWWIHVTDTFSKYITTTFNNTYAQQLLFWLEPGIENLHLCNILINGAGTLAQHHASATKIHNKSDVNLLTHFGTKFETTTVNNLENNRNWLTSSITAQLHIDWSFLISSQPWVKVQSLTTNAILAKQLTYCSFHALKLELKSFQNRSDKSQQFKTCLLTT